MRAKGVPPPKKTTETHPIRVTSVKSNLRGKILGKVQKLPLKKRPIRVSQPEMEAARALMGLSK